MKSEFVRSIIFSIVLVSAVGCQSFHGDRVYHGGGPVGLSGRFGGCSDCQTQGSSCTQCQGYTPTGMIHQAMTCGSGCGELYFDEWLNDPPGCEPCDDCGNWVGKHPRAPRPIFWRLRALFAGQRFHESGCGCSSCGAESVEWIDAPETSKPADTDKTNQPTPAEQKTAQKKWSRRVGHRH